MPAEGEETSGAAAEVVAAVNEAGPIIAFEDSITSPKPEPPVAGKTTKDSFLQGFLWVRILLVSSSLLSDLLS